MIEAWASLLGGLVMLILGGDWIVTGAAGLADRFKLPPMVVGVTVMAFGTSAPELAASLDAAFRGTPDLVLGTVSGSNLANIGLILGLCALATPLASGPDFMRRSAPSLIGAALALLAVSWDGALSRLEGGLLLAGVPAFVWLFTHGERAVGGADDEDDAEGRPLWQLGAFVIAGGALLAFGADLFVDGAVSLARAWGVEERLIGLTLVAIGTSLPELVSSAAASWRGQGALIVGNVVGSNVLNVLAILGITGLVCPFAVDTPPRMDAGMVLIASVVAVIALATRGRLSRIEGGVLLAGYAAIVGLVFF